MTLPIQFLGLTTGTHNFLLRAGVRYICDAAELVDAGYHPKIPAKCIAETRKCIEEFELLHNTKLLKARNGNE